MTDGTADITRRVELERGRGKAGALPFRYRNVYLLSADKLLHSRKY